MTFDTFNGSQPWEILAYIDDVTNNWFGKFLLLIIFITCYLAMGGTTSNRAFAGATFLTSVITMLFWFIGIVEIGFVYIAILCIILSVVFLLAESRG